MKACKDCIYCKITADNKWCDYSYSKVPESVAEYYEDKLDFFMGYIPIEVARSNSNLCGISGVKFYAKN